MTGSHRSKACLTGASLKPSSARRCPTALALMPTRCSAETAFGDAVLHASVGVHDHHAITDARGDRGGAAAGLEREGALGDHLREAIEDGQVGPLQLAGLSAGSRRPLLRQRRDTRPWRRTGIASIRVTPGMPSTAISPSTGRPRRRPGRAPRSRTRWPTSRPSRRCRASGRSRADVAHHQPPAVAVAVGAVEQHVGEAEVGQHPPVGRRPAGGGGRRRGRARCAARARSDRVATARQSGPGVCC